MLLDLVAVIPQIPRNFPKFHNERGGPSFAGVASAKSEEVSVLCSSPFDSDASFKESEPSDLVLCIDGLKKTWHVRLGKGQGLGATPFGETLSDPADDVLGAAPFGETLNDPADDVLGDVNRLEPFAEGGHEQSPNKEDCWFLAGPNTTSVLVLSTARTS